MPRINIPCRAEESLLRGYSVVAFWFGVCVYYCRFDSLNGVKEYLGRDTSLIANHSKPQNQTETTTWNCFDADFQHDEIPPIGIWLFCMLALLITSDSHLRDYLTTVSPSISSHSYICSFNLTHCCCSYLSGDSTGRHPARSSYKHNRSEANRTSSCGFDKWKWHYCIQQCGRCSWCRCSSS